MPRVLGQLLALWHLLSLDAPTVAVVWLLFVAATLGRALPPAVPVALFLAVWILYAADRLLDAQPWRQPATNASEEADLELRHHFHHRHRRLFFPALGVAMLALSALLPRLPAPVLRDEAFLAVLLGIWFARVHWPAGRHRGTPLPKEFPVGFFFAVAVFCPSLAGNRGEWPAELPAAAAFALICLLNCLYLYAWEHPCEGSGAGVEPGARSGAHPLTRWAVDRLHTLGPLLLAVLLVAAGAAGRSGAVRLAPLFVACALSTAALLLLDRCRRRLPPLTLRALADLALLTPLALRHGAPWH